MSRFKVKFPNGYTKYCYSFDRIHALEKAIHDPKGEIDKTGCGRVDVDSKIYFDQEQDAIGVKTDAGIVWCRLG